MQAAAKCQVAVIFGPNLGSEEPAHIRSEEANHRYCDLLRARRQRPSNRRAAEERNEVAPFHSITASAMASSVGGTSRPSVRAVWRLMTNSNFVACTTGKSAGFSPLRIRPT